jgi:hypothetical protein
MLIYLSTGEVLEFPAATNLSLDGKQLLVLKGKDVLTSLPQALVWSSSKVKAAPVPS